MTGPADDDGVDIGELLDSRTFRRALNAPTAGGVDARELLDSRTFCRALKDAGILANLNRTTKVTLIAEPGEVVRIHVEYVADGRLTKLIPTLESSHDHTGAHAS
jgi:hypothetical protein